MKENDVDGKLAEVFLSEAPPVKKKKVDQKHLTAQRNIPREVVNVLTEQPSLRQMVWVLSKLPKGVQTARLMRYMEDKGWRLLELGKTRLMYHGRSFTAIDDIRPMKNMTIYGIYSMLRPRESEAGDLQQIDRGLVKLWGLRQIGDMEEYVINTIPSRSFMRFILSPNEVEKANNIADQLYQHTGIIIEPISVKYPLGEPVSATDQPKSDLPDNVAPDDPLIVSEDGYFFMILAKDLSTGVFYDSKAVLDKGHTTVITKDAGESVGGEDNSDWEDMTKYFGKLGGKEGSKLFGKANVKAQDDNSPGDVKIKGDGILSRMIIRVKNMGKDYVFVVNGATKGKGKAPQVDTHPIMQPYKRGGIYGEDRRLASNIKETDGLPVKPGKWSISELSKYIRMFERDYGVKL